MDHIPGKILHLFYIQLNLKDRLECMRVCRTWYGCLDQYSLHYVIDIGVSRFSKLINMLEELPHRAAQMEYLKLGTFLGPDFDAREICNLFPNLRKLVSVSIGREIAKYIYMNNPFHFKYQTSKLEMVKDGGQCGVTRQLISFNLCSQLKYLQLNFRGSSSSEINHVVAEPKNMPNLSNLHLNHFRFWSKYLETIHVKLPSITSLYITSTVLGSDDIPHNAISLQHLSQNWNWVLKSLEVHVATYNFTST